MIKLSKAVSN